MDALNVQVVDGGNLNILRPRIAATIFLALSLTGQRPLRCGNETLVRPPPALALHGRDKRGGLGRSTTSSIRSSPAQRVEGSTRGCARRDDLTVVMFWDRMWQVRDKAQSDRHRRLSVSPQTRASNTNTSTPMAFLIVEHLLPQHITASQYRVIRRSTPLR